MNLKMLFIVPCFVLQACSGNSAEMLASEGNNSETDSNLSSDMGQSTSGTSAPIEWPAQSETATYQITIFNDWGVDNYPQDFPDDAHLSAIGGVSHNGAVAFWESGGQASPGIVDIAESGIVDTFIDNEVAFSIEAGLAYAAIAYLEPTGANIHGNSGMQTFGIEMQKSWPLLTLATKLSPSPDWFVGLSSMPLYQSDTGWKNSIQVTLPLMDVGSKSGVIPMNGGPNVLPPDPISSLVYDSATGTYVTGERPSFVARLEISRIQ